MSSIDRIITMLRNELDRHEMLQVINDFSEDFDLGQYLGDWDESELEEFFKNKFPSYVNTKNMDSGSFIYTGDVSPESLLELHAAHRERLMEAVFKRAIADNFSELSSEETIECATDGLVDLRPEIAFASLNEKHKDSFFKNVYSRILLADNLEPLHQLHAKLLTDRLEIAEVVDHLCQLSPHGKEAAGKSFIEHATDSDWNNLISELTSDKAAFVLKAVFSTHSDLKPKKVGQSIELVAFPNLRYCLFIDGSYVHDINDLSLARALVDTVEFVNIIPKEWDTAGYDPQEAYDAYFNSALY